jgi:hypothetical protein
MVAVSFLLVLHAALVVANSQLHMKIYWVPNRAGLFSHFLQLKRMYIHAAPLQRLLVVAPSKSPHYGNLTINMCSIFELPAGLECAPVRDHLRCTNNYEELPWKEPAVCYNGSITFGAEQKGRYFVLGAVDVPVHLRFRSAFQEQAARFRLALSNHLQGSSSLVVVHWRRGDQLLGRCTNKVDASVNCGDGSTLVEQVFMALSKTDPQHNSDHTIVYVATNEPQDSPHMDTLRASGFITLQDVTRKSNDPRLRKMSLFEVLTAEVSLMLTAETFLGWGISEINDVVEYERRQHGRTHCVTARLDRAEGRRATAAQETWCTLQLQRNSTDSTVTTTVVQRSFLQGVVGP